MHLGNTRGPNIERKIRNVVREKEIERQRRNLRKRKRV